MTGVAVNVTEVPSQTMPAGLALTTTLTGREDPTDITKVFEIAGLPVGQVTSEVRMQVTASASEGI